MSSVRASNSKLGFLWLAVLLTTACTSPLERARQFANEQKLSSEIVRGAAFQHQVFRKQARPSERLHIYLDGDGSPWLLGQFVSNDPTPRQPLALQLMAAAPYSAIYLGRPCYFGLAETPPCAPRYWTSARYGEDVVNSLVTAITQLRQGQQQLLLIGYSGGGALATLVATRLKGDIQLVTVAGNLDISAWTTLHGYLPLNDSLNPILEPRGSLNRQIHLSGLQDRNTPPELARAYIKRHGGTLRRFPDFDHVCCWRENWPTILESLLVEGNSGLGRKDERQR